MHVNFIFLLVLCAVLSQRIIAKLSDAESNKILRNNFLETHKQNNDKIIEQNDYSAVYLAANNADENKTNESTDECVTEKDEHDKDDDDENMDEDVSDGEEYEEDVTAADEDDYVIEDDEDEVVSDDDEDGIVSDYDVDLSRIKEMSSNNNTAIEVNDDSQENVTNDVEILAQNYTKLQQQQSNLNENENWKTGTVNTTKLNSTKIATNGTQTPSPKHEDNLVRENLPILQRHKFGKPFNQFSTLFGSQISNINDGSDVSDTIMATNAEQQKPQQQQEKQELQQEIHQLEQSPPDESVQLQRLKNYNFLYNAERQTYFQLYTNAINVYDDKRLLDNGGQLFQNVVGNTFNTLFGFNAGLLPPGKQSMGSASASKVQPIVESVQLYDAASLRQTHYNPFNPTRIIIHGWLGNSHANIYATLVPIYLQLNSGNYNIFTVDWGRGAFADYVTASYRVKPVAKVLAKFIDFLHREAGMRFEDLEVIGFSMGAHIAGIAGKHLQTGRLRIIHALDPALPMWRYANTDERLARTDADYVQVLHTSVGSYGFDRPLGHIDFYANWGSQQPGCYWNECSHWRAFQLFAATLQQPFKAYGCARDQWRDLIQNRRCLEQSAKKINMIGDFFNVKVDLTAATSTRRGLYYFQTNGIAPYTNEKS